MSTNTTEALAIFMISTTLLNLALTPLYFKKQHKASIFSISTILSNPIVLSKAEGGFMTWKSLPFLSLAGEGFDKIYRRRFEAFLGRNVFKKKLLNVFRELRKGNA